LEGILGVVLVEEATAYTPDHRAVPPHEGCEGGFLPMLDEALKELSIGQSRSIWQKHGSAKVLDDLAHLVRRHVPPSGGSSPALDLFISRTMVI
jgi:hypothetical protein